MSSLNSVLNDASSGLQAAQTGLQVVSNNVSNVNTPGYVQTQSNQSPLVSGAQGSGVTVTDIQRITNKYLEGASYSANAQSASASAISSAMDAAQSLFGDPTTTGSLFSNLDSVFTAFSTLAATPTTAASSAAISATASFFSQAQSISTSLTSLSTQTDSQISSNVSTVNQLLSQISQLNTTISQNQVSGQDATGAQNEQGQLVTQLSSLMNLQVNATPTGGVQILAGDGTTLVGTDGAASLTYTPGAASGVISVTNPGGLSKSLNGAITSGAVGGLLQLRNSSIPTLQSQLTALTTGAATALNAASNTASAVPAPTTLTGRQTGLALSTIVGDFSGQTTIALVNPTTNALANSVAINFTAKTISVNGGAATSFTAANFLTTLNTAMASTGASASYTNGVLSISSGSQDGVAIQDSASDPATDGGQGFSQFFGLNDLVSSGSITTYATGMNAADSSGFPAGQSLTLAVLNANGNTVQNVTVTTPAGGTMADLITALNGPPGGVGAYGSFALSGNGTLAFTPKVAGDSLAVSSDQTANTASGTSLSQLFGIGAATQNTAAATFSVNSAISQNPANLPTATLNLSAPAGSAVLAPGDTSGADAISQASLASLSFPAVSGVAAATTTLSNYAASISGSIADAASAADNAQATAATTASNATAALSSVEGVSIDQEMINLTTYQQAYNASARMIQAANDLFTTLLSMTGT